jgi:hypothetical protein
MDVRSYYGKLIRAALTHSLDITHGAIFVLVIVVGATAWYVPSMRDYLKQLDVEGWQVGIVVLAAIVVLRLFSAPYWIHSEQGQELATSQNALHAISEERPFTFVTISCNAVGNNFHATPVWDIKRIHLLFENLSKRLLKFNVIRIAIEHDGREDSVPIREDGGTFIHGEQQMTYGFDVIGISTSKFPFVLTVSFDVHYDNVPPISIRGTRRKIRYTMHSFKPVAADNLIIEQDEYRVNDL